MKNSFLVFATLCLLAMLSSASLYDEHRSDVQILTGINFEKQVSKNREKGISVVHFYEKGDGKSPDFSKDYEKFAKSNRGMFRIGAVDCEQHRQVCSKEGVTSFPTYRVYPPFPMPHVDLTEADVTTDQIKKVAGKYVGNRAIEITEANHQTFVSDNPGTAKVLLFTSSAKGTPLVLKALSTHFDQTLEFGLVRDTETALVAKYKVKSFPAVFIIKADEAKPLKFEGDDFSYQAIFDFINIYSETFVFGGTKDEIVSAASKPWLTVKIPQMTIESANDVCLKKEGALCVIYVTKDSSSINQDHFDQMQLAGQSFASKISRGIQFLFSYIDGSQDPDWVKLFGLQQEDLPKLVVLNPGKKKRFLIHDYDLNEEGISKTLDKILGGDSKFTTIKGGKLPEFVSNYPTQ